MKKSVITLSFLCGVIGLFAKNDFGNLLNFQDQHFPSYVTIKKKKSDKELINLKFDSKKYAQNFVAINKNEPTFNKKVQETNVELRNNSSNLEEDRPSVDYQGLDSLGRTQEVTGYVTFNDVYQHSSRVRKRPSFPYSTIVSGEFLNSKYVNHHWIDSNQSNNKIMDLGNYRGYIFNKSHLLAYSLGGSMDTENVIWGTRAQNVGTNSQKSPGGMAYPETKVREYLKRHKNDCVCYVATPVYKGRELVPRGVKVMYAAIKKPKNFHGNLWIFNAQNGVHIDYMTGTAKKE